MIQFLVLFCLMSLSYGVNAMDGAAAGAGSSQNPGGSPGKDVGGKKAFRLPDCMQFKGFDDDTRLVFGYRPEESVSDGDSSGGDLFEGRTSPFSNSLREQCREVVGQAIYIRESLEKGGEEAREVAALRAKLDKKQKDYISYLENVARKEVEKNNRLIREAGEMQRHLGLAQKRVDAFKEEEARREAEVYANMQTMQEQPESVRETATRAAPLLGLSETNTVFFPPTLSFEGQFAKGKDTRRIQELESDLRESRRVCAKRESAVLVAERDKKNAEAQLGQARAQIASLEAAQQQTSQTVPSAEIKPEEIKPAPKQSNYPALASASLGSLLASRLLANAWSNRKGFRYLRSRRREKMSEEERELHAQMLKRVSVYGVSGLLAALASGYGAYRSTGSVLKTIGLLLAMGLLERGATISDELFLHEEQDAKEAAMTTETKPLSIAVAGV